MVQAHLHLHKNGTARVKFGTGAAFLWHGPDKLSNVNRSGLVFFGTWAFFLPVPRPKKWVVSARVERPVPKFLRYAHAHFLFQNGGKTYKK